MLSTCCDVYGQVDSNFIENAFLSPSLKIATIYKDSICKDSFKKIQSNIAVDKYFVFQVIDVFQKRAKVIARSTIDAGHYDSSVFMGWININNLCVYYNKIKNSNLFVYQYSNRKSKKNYANLKAFIEPLQIKNFVFKNKELWIEVRIKKEKELMATGWLSPELQCTDVWNACSGN